MTLEELQAFEEANWARVDQGLRDKCVWLLREFIYTEDQSRIAEWFMAGEMPLGFHRFGGTQIRNILRGVIKDKDLPDVP